MLCSTLLGIEVTSQMKWHCQRLCIVSLQEIQEKMKNEVGPIDPLDVDNQKITDNLTNASQQPSSPYGAIPNGSAANGDGKF